jgi:uncharacterized membrane protein YeaQ/YmgE (transglycosylase-associated protein family)
MNRPKADWLGWILQFILGFIAGVVGGFVLASRRRSGWWLNSGMVLYFILGAGLLGGDLASHYGDRLWMEVRTFPLYENGASGFVGGFRIGANVIAVRRGASDPV